MDSGVGIVGISTCLPNECELNEDLNWLEKDVKSRLIQAIGINKRYIDRSNKGLNFFAERASRNLLESTKIRPDEIGPLVLVTQTGETKIPNNVIQLQDALEIPGSNPCLEINLGCSGFVQGLHTITQLLSASQKKYGLLICGDISSKILEPEDSGTIPLFSDAVSAILITNSENFGTYSFGNSAMNSDAIALKRNAKNDYLKLDGHKILTMGLKSVVPDVRNMLSSNEQEIDYYFFHQASKIINDTLVRKLGIFHDKCPETLSSFGNTSSATIPLTMSTVDHLSERKNRILICGFGTGLSWASAILDIDPINHFSIIHA